MAAQVFISNDKVTVVGLIVAGSAEFKTVLVEAERFDPRLAAKVIMVCDVSYGGENGLNQAIEQSAEMLSNVKFIQEKKVIKKYFDEIAQDTGKICFGVDDTTDTHTHTHKHARAHTHTHTHTDTHLI